jgi:NAD(P)-dependent dehydrogenase (short-subunit alcohol dehydrogenase family)
MKNSSDARIINVSSMHHSRGQIHFNDINLDKNYDPVEAYCQSKLSNILFTKELAKRLGNDSNIKVYALHPGTIKSDLFRHLTGLRSVIFNIIGFLFNIDIELGVQTTLYCALEESLRYETGYYYR